MALERLVKGRRPLIVAALGLAISLAGGCAPLKLFLQGGQRQLHAELQRSVPIRRVIIFALDGVAYDQFMAAVDSPKAVNIRKLFGAASGGGLFEHAYSAPAVISILPTTLPGWAAIFTGQPPAWNGVTGDEFFIRQTQTLYAPVPVSIKDPDDTLRMLSAGLLGKVIESPTLFEVLGLRSYVSLNGVYRGADVFTGLNRTAWADLLATLAKGFVTGAQVHREIFAKIDDDSVAALIDNLKARGLPDLQVVYFPGIDLFTHRSPNPLSAQVDYLISVTDHDVGRVLYYYDSVGALGQTYVLFISDHGHVPVLPDNRHALGSNQNNALPTLLSQAGFRVRKFTLDLAPEDQDYQAVLAYQGVMAYIYLADRSRCEKKGQRCDWRRPPRLEEDVMPLIRTLYAANQKSGPGSPLGGTIDLIFARPPVAPGKQAAEFQIFDGERLVPIYRYLELHPRPDLVELDRRMRSLSAGPRGDRAGDIIVLPHFGLSLPIGQRYYFGPVYLSEHGSPSLQDSHIPFVLAKKGGSGERLRRAVRKIAGPNPSQLDVVPLVRRLLRRDLEQP